MGVLDGNASDMAQVLANVTTSAKGLYAMKALAGGNLLEDIPRNLAYVRDTVGIPVVAVGMIRRTELEMNLALFQGETVSETLLNASKQFRKKAKVTFLCKGCGRCVSYCHNHALSIVNGRAVIDEEQCLLCGYCSRECPQFAIRVI
jgi:ferredoxin